MQSIFIFCTAKNVIAQIRCSKQFAGKGIQLFFLSIFLLFSENMYMYLSLFAWGALALQCNGSFRAWSWPISIFIEVKAPNIIENSVLYNICRPITILYLKAKFEIWVRKEGLRISSCTTHWCLTYIWNWFCLRQFPLWKSEMHVEKKEVMQR